MSNPTMIGIEYQFPEGEGLTRRLVRKGYVFTDLGAAAAAAKEAIRDGARSITVTPGRIPPSVLADDLRAYSTAKYGSVGALVILHQDQWLQRREEYGNHAPLTALIDGHPLYQVLNGHIEGRQGREHYEAFGRFCEERGWYWELGFSWSVHFYPRGI